MVRVVIMTRLHESVPVDERLNLNSRLVRDWTGQQGCVSLKQIKDA